MDSGGGQAQVVASSGLKEEEIRDGIADIAGSVRALLDRRSPSSELARFNAAPPGTWMLSDPLWEVLNQALDLADDVGGAYDPTLGALNDVWAEAATALSLTPPDDAALEAPRAVSGWGRFRLNRPAQAAVQPGGARLDFDDVVDAIACDRVLRALVDRGVEAASVRIGRNVIGRGLQADAMPWWAEIWSAGESGPRWVVALLDLAVGVSGFGGRPPVDGASGRPVDHDLQGVVALDPSGLRAQAMARALHVMGPFEGPEIAAAMDIPALFIQRTPYGIVERLSPALAAMEDDAGQA
ncbi:FAD:protein FMN transferase [Brevundimonas balnearis]|uniref:FAD:protein FMN transferase n=1 Tax=Brevundimonas balnearis TaxID=1572858 RepID=A0ABV6QZG4_9CAUL